MLSAEGPASPISFPFILAAAVTSSNLIMQTISTLHQLGVWHSHYSLHSWCLLERTMLRNVERHPAVPSLQSSMATTPRHCKDALCMCHAGTNLDIQAKLCNTDVVTIHTAAWYSQGGQVSLSCMPPFAMRHCPTTAVDSCVV